MITVRRSLYAAIALMMFAGASRAPAQGGNDWYRVRPPSPREKNAPLFLPRSAERPVIAVAADTEQIAISKLAENEILPLAVHDFRELNIRSAPGDLLEELIRSEATAIEDKWQDAYMEGYGWYKRHLHYAIPGSKETAGYWERMKTHLRPYLVRAVSSSEGTESKYYASFWTGNLTITHSSTVTDDSHDRLHQYVTMGAPPNPDKLTKSPVIVYLEAKPMATYTRVDILKLGR
jgi:hypothetical protein